MIKLKDLYPNQASFMKEETISEGPDSELFKKLAKHQNEIFKLLNNYKSKANVPAIARSFMIGLKNQLKKDKMVESINENREIDKVYGDFEVLLKDFEKEFRSLSAQAGRANDDKTDERILLKTLKKHIVPLYSMVRSWNRSSKRD
tara:strand:+ start:167 stop:604 length:438 start_codon:yes stop_codon:yes gene_type:complete